MGTRLLWLCLALSVALASKAHAQAALPRHLQIEPVASLSGVSTTLDTRTWNPLFGGRIAVSMTPRILFSAGLWPKQAVDALWVTGEDAPTDRLGQWNAGLRLVVPVAAQYGIFGTFSVGGGAIQSKEDTYYGVATGLHLEYWLVPTLLFRSGFEGTFTGDRGSRNLQVGVAYVPLRW